MNKTILLIFEPANQKHLVSNLLMQMRKRGLQIDAFNSYKWEYLDTDKEIPLKYRLLRRLLFVPKLGTFIRDHFHTLLLLSVSKPYDLVDIHFFWRTFIPFLRKTSKPYKISIWGSDFYRERVDIQEQKKILYENALMIQVETDEVRNDVIKYDSRLDGKIGVCNFGVDVIDTMSQPEIGRLVSEDVLKDRIIVAIGYNGSKAQQHELLIHSVCQLPESYKNHIYLYIPATYGLSKEYKEILTDTLNKSGIPYHLFDKRLSEVELAQLRRDSDIAMNAQITDTLNASLLQHLYAGSIVIVGDWLPYGIYERHNILYYKASHDGFTEQLEYCLDNYAIIKNAVSLNKERVLEFATWEAVSGKQFELFQSFIELS